MFEGPGKVGISLLAIQGGVHFHNTRHASVDTIMRGVLALTALIV